MNDLILKQIRLSERVVLEDRFKNIENVGGVSQVFSKNKVVSCFVSCSYPEIGFIEKSCSEIRTDFPYISGLLAYREGPSIILAYKNLKKKPDLILIKGSGICHPRFFGMASHIGLILDKPSIGITERLLCGEIKEKKIIYEGRHVGWKLKNIYISPGHKVSLETSLKIVKNCIKKHKLPEPLYLAYKYANKKS